MRHTLACLVALTLAGGIAQAQSITYDVDKAARFSSYRTYAWVPGVTQVDELNDKRIVEAVDAQLAAKGLVRATGGARPDVLVAYHVAFDKDVRVSGFSSGWGPYRFAGSSGTAYVDKLLVGTLAIDVMDGQTNAIVWRGRATKEIDPQADPQKRTRNINKAAERLLKTYPGVKEGGRS